MSQVSKLILFMLVVATGSGHAFECSNAIMTENHVNAVPNELVDATITVTTAKGKVYRMSSNEYMVAKRVQAVSRLERTCISTKSQEESLNIVSMGVRKDFTGLTTNKFTPNQVTVEAHKSPVLDLQYYRRQVLDVIGAGLSLDSNGTPRALVGVEF